MNIEALTASGIETAFKLLGTLVGLGSFFQAVSGSGSATYDPIQDTIITPTQDYFNVRMLKLPVGEEELLGTAVTVTDVKILVPGVDLAGVEPSTQDHIMLKGTRYNVVRPRPVPGGSLHILYCREA
jgi:hypothetical protein